MPHLPTLIGYLGDADITSVLAAHRRTLTELDASLSTAATSAATNNPEASADRTIRVLLGPRQRPETPSAALEFSDDRDPVSRMRRRLRHLQSCPICAEIDDACAEWLHWLARQAETDDDLSDVLPLCREHVWQARCVGGPALAPALAATVLHEAEERLVYAEKAIERVRRAWFRPAARGAVLGSLGQSRECPLCRRAREAGQRAILLLTALLKDTDGRSAFESGYGLCVRHAAQALSLPDEQPAGNIIASTTHARLAMLRWEIEEQLRRGAWQARPERRGAESGAWLKAGARFAGTVRLAGTGV